MTNTRSPRGSLRVILGQADYAKLDSIAKRSDMGRPATNAKGLALFVIRQYIDRNYDTPKS